MCELNKIGQLLADQTDVHAMTDVTGFGLLGHLTEICEGSGLSAKINFSRVPTLSGIEDYIAQGAIPGGAGRNFESYGKKVSEVTELQKVILCDPQTSGGLLISVSKRSVHSMIELALKEGITLKEIGVMQVKSNTDSAVIYVD
jgi:selenide,water dikinase